MRLDKWLYYSRFYSSRFMSKKACIDGDVLVNKIKKYNASYSVTVSDIITIIKKQKLIIVKVIKLPNNRIASKFLNNIYEIIKI
tara:strand:+ start:169 stop:420 length:252 start_codon:yes stop_codon:yes gene_type:complete